MFRKTPAIVALVGLLATSALPRAAWPAPIEILPELPPTHEEPALETLQALPSMLPDLTGASDGVWGDLLPTVIDFCSAIFDSAQDRVIVLGQSDLMWAHRLDGTPGWQRLIPAGSGPPIQQRPKLVVPDPARGRVVVLCYGQAWSLRLTDPPRWELLRTSGTPPDCWWYPSVMLDPVRDRILLFGGYGGQSYRNDTWALSLSEVPTWSLVTTMGDRPARRNFHTATYDPVRDRMIVHGGANNPYFWGLFDTWALSLSGTPSWERLNDGSTLPSGQQGHTAEYDPLHDRLLAFFGYGGSGARSDVWALSLEDLQWREVRPAVPIPPRGNHASCFDAARHRVIVYGGRSRSQSFPYLADLWGMDLNDPPSWLPIEPAPPPRANAAVTMDPVKERLLVFGGWDGARYLDDVWVLESNPVPRWIELHPQGSPPRARVSPTLIFDSPRDRAILFGGASTVGPAGDAWALNLAGTPRWQLVAPEGSGPQGRYGHVATYDPAGRRMVVFGGAANGRLFGDLWSFDLDGAGSWREILPSGRGPSNRVFSAAAFDPLARSLIVVGGQDADSLRDDTWKLSFAGTPTWTSIDGEGSKPSRGDGRYLHAAAFDPSRRRMLVYGGADSTGALNDTWELPVREGGWRRLAVGGNLPAAKVQPLVGYDAGHSRLLLFGVGRGFGNEILALQFEPVPSGPTHVRVDVRPGDEVDAVNPGSHGALPVAILSGADFDATTVDPLSVRLAGAGVHLRPDGGARVWTTDVDNDGLPDLVLHVEEADLDLAPGDTLAFLSCLTKGSEEIYGVGRVKVVGGRPIHGEATPAQARSEAGSGEPALLNARVRDARIVVSLRLRADLPMRLELLDVVGRRIDGTRGTGGSGEIQEFTLGSRGLAPGIYWVRLEQAGRAFTRRVVVLR